MRAAARVLRDRDQARHAAALEVLAAHEVPRALRRDEADVDAGRRLDLAVVDREAVAEQQRVALGDPVADLVLVDVVVQFVGDEDHHDVAARRGLGDRQHLEPALAGGVGGRGALAQADDHGYAGVLEVQRVGVALRAEADDRDGLAVEEAEVCVVVVEHAGRILCTRGCGRATGRRAGGLGLAAPSAAATGWAPPAGGAAARRRVARRA